MDIYDIAGIGVGPVNLSLALLHDPLKITNSIVLEEKAEFPRHTGMMTEWAAPPPGGSILESRLAYV